MNLREAYLYISENKLKDFIKKRCNRITSIKFMLEETVYREVLSDNSYCIDMLFSSIKDEILYRYVTSEATLKQDRYYFRIKDIENSFAEKKVRKILMREKPDVYHLNVIYNPCGARSAHELGIPVVWHLREFAEIDSNTPFFRNRDKAYNLIAQSEKIVCVSDSIKEFYSQFIPADNMVRIYDGIIISRDNTRR